MSGGAMEYFYPNKPESMDDTNQPIFKFSNSNNFSPPTKRNVIIDNCCDSMKKVADNLINLPTPFVKNNLPQ